MGGGERRSESRSSGGSRSRRSGHRWRLHVRCRHVSVHLHVRLLICERSRSGWLWLLLLLLLHGLKRLRRWRRGHARSRWRLLHRLLRHEHVVQVEIRSIAELIVKQAARSSRSDERSRGRRWSWSRWLQGSLVLLLLLGWLP